MNHHTRIPESLIAQFNELIARHTGLYFSRERWPDLERCVINAAPGPGPVDVNGFIQSFMTTPLSRQTVEILASHLTVGETYFFREPESFEAIEKHILADLIRNRRGKDQHLRIWSAGCATGEEPYSLAILLHQLIPDISDWNISILATDINPQFLQKAEQGVYTGWSFRGVPGRIKDKYFTMSANGRFRIHPYIKRLVTFGYLNLAEDIYPSLINGTNGMDLILCRNVLMYFSMPRAKQVIENLHRSLVDEGCLAVSSVEVSHILFAAFDPVNFQDVTLYRKAGAYTRGPGHGDDLSPQAVYTELNTFEAEPAIHAEVPPPAIEETILPADIMGTETVKTETDIHEAVAGLYRQGRYAEVVKKLTAGPTGMPQDAHAMEFMARALANQGRLAEAIGWCEKAIDGNKMESALYYLLAIIRQECGQTDEAVTALKRALYLEPELVLAHFALGNLTCSQGKTLEANRHFSNTLALLDKYQPGDILPESGGITAQRLREIIETVRYNRDAA